MIQLLHKSILAVALLVMTSATTWAQADLTSPTVDEPIAQPALPLTTVDFEETSHDFGAIQEGEMVSHTFKFRNIGTAPLRCTNVKPSCGCTSPDWTKTDVLPGEEGFVTVQFDSKGKMGMQKKSVTVTFENTDPHNIILAFSAEVLVDGSATPAENLIFEKLIIGTDEHAQPASIETGELPPAGAQQPAPPADLRIATPVPPLATTTVQFRHETHDFGKIEEGKKVSYTFKFKNTGKEPLVIDKVKPSCGCTTPDWTHGEIAPGKKGEITIEFDSKGKRGIQKKSVTVTFANTDPQNKILSFSGEVVLEE